MKTTLLVLFTALRTLSFSQGSSCSNAYTLPLDEISRNYTVSSATGTCVFCTTTGYSGHTGRVTWFQFTTDDKPQCVLIDLSASSVVTMELVLYSSCTAGVPLPLGGLYNHNMCMSNGNGYWAQNLFDNLAPYTTYYLKVRTQGGYTGDVQIAGKYYTPPNKDCFGATSISSNVSVGDNNACHTPGTVPATQLCAITLENTAWYTYVVQASGSSTITIDNISCNNGDGNANNGFQIGFFQGTCSSLIPLTCSSGAGGTVTATATGLTGGTRIYVAIDGYSGSNCSYTINATNASPLPVKWKNFYASREASGNSLKWTTTNEDHNLYFEVQRSEDGKNFLELGRLPARQSAGDNEYSFADNNPFRVSYYRLKQVDDDGKFSYSNIVLVNRDDVKSLRLLSVNSLNHQLSVRVQSELSAGGQFNIYNAQGNLVLASSITINKGINNYQKDISSLSKGLYIIVMTTGNERLTRSFAIN